MYHVFFFYYSSQSKQWSAQFIEATIQRNLPTGHLKFIKSNLYQLFKVVLTVNKMIMVDILSVTLQFIKRKKKKNLNTIEDIHWETKTLFCLV